MSLPNDLESQTRQLWAAAHFHRRAKDRNQRNAVRVLEHLARAASPKLRERAKAVLSIPAADT